MKRKDHKPTLGSGLDILKYIGPGLLVTVGFIDPGNWASNLAAGSTFGYQLLWMVTLSTIMLIILQHNVAHLGIASGLCLSEATAKYVRKPFAQLILGSAVLASISTALAEVMGGAIALNMLFHLPLHIGSVLISIMILVMLLSNSYRYLERWIIGFVSLIGISFVIEILWVNVSWDQACIGWIKPVFPANSMLIIMSVLGAVVMPHNLFLHSEIIQSRQWNLQDDKIIHKQLDYEFIDTLLSMVIGWAINSAMILLAASTFFQHGLQVTELQQASELLKPIVGSSASTLFALALLFAGIASSITAGMAGGTIFAGIFSESYDIKDQHTKVGVMLTVIPALIIIFFIKDAFQALVVSQMLLSIQLPFTIFTQIYLTSSPKVMGKFANTKGTFRVLMLIGLLVTYLNIRLLVSILS